MDTTGTSDWRTLAELIADIKVALLHTLVGEPGRPHVRPMYTQPLDSEGFDGELWFMTDAETAKVQEIRADPRVLITYADPSRNRYVVVQGQASVESNPRKARELWNVHAKGWYPDGPESPGLRLIRVAVMAGEYWDGPSTTAYSLDLARALFTSSRMNPPDQHGLVG